ncbi:hypothetical protein Pd630_LPD12009 (plasmid) [Rhodococcus opacus PD630]|nr:hypothetical protein Pd630_LPD12009 [Rhodococcus opacus PD630]
MTCISNYRRQLFVGYDSILIGHRNLINLQFFDIIPVPMPPAFYQFGKVILNIEQARVRTRLIDLGYLNAESLWIVDRKVNREIRTVPVPYFGEAVFVVDAMQNRPLESCLRRRRARLLHHPSPITPSRPHTCSSDVLSGILA